MRNLSEEWEVLDLTDAESKVLWALIEGGTQSVSAAARAAQIPRTTVDAALRRLHERKLVRPVSRTGSGHRRFWKAARPERVSREMEEATLPFKEERGDPPTSLQMVGNTDPEELGVHVFHGKQPVLKAYEELLGLSETNRIYLIQGNQSADVLLNQLDRQYLLDFKQKIRKTGVVMEGFGGEYLLDIFRRCSVQALQQHKERLAVLALLPDVYTNFSLDIAVFDEAVFLINLVDETVIIVKNVAIVGIFQGFVRLLHDASHSFDLERYLREIIEKSWRA